MDIGADAAARLPFEYCNERSQNKAESRFYLLFSNLDSKSATGAELFPYLGFSRVFYGG